jgi:hypothetical protein
MKSATPVIVLTFLVSFIIIMAYFIPGLGLDSMVDELTNGGIIVAAFALGLASVNLFRIHVLRIMNKRGEWWNSVLLLGSMIFMLAFGLILGPKSAPYAFGFDNLYTPLGATMYASLAFWIASASYRAFIARSLEAGILLVSATVVLLGKAPVGEIIWDKFPAMGHWIMTVPNTAAMRGIMIGAAVGAIAMGIRVMIGIERGYLGGGEE